MSSGAILIWFVQAIMTWWVYRDLGPAGSRFVARALGIQSDHWIWTWLIGLALLSMFVNSRIAANAYSAFTGKRPGEDWHAYGQSGGSMACYWCGLTSFASCLLVLPQTLQRVGLSGIRAGIIYVATLLVNAVLIRVVVRVLFRRRLGPVQNCSAQALTGKDCG
jgi:hypothetical protein